MKRGLPRQAALPCFLFFKFNSSFFHTVRVQTHFSLSSPRFRLIGRLGGHCQRQYSQLNLMFSAFYLSVEQRFLLIASSESLASL